MVKAKVYIKPKVESKIKSGYLWIFQNQILEEPQARPGEIVEVFSQKEESFGLAFYNPKSKIRLRMLNTTINHSIEDIIAERISKAHQLRQILFNKEKMYRLSYGESDLLPGLIIDRYGNYFVLQINSAGMENLIPNIVEVIRKLYPYTKGIYAKNTTSFRTLEGLPHYEKILYGTIPEKIVLNEFDIKYQVSLLSSQKTGLFLDQKMNRLFIRNLARSLNVLDCYCNVGGFGLNALRGGAKSVTFVDISKNALEETKKNCSLNGFLNTEFKQEDVKDFLRNSSYFSKKFDLIILDPPAFSKSKSKIQNAIAGYVQIHKYALRLLSPNGFLATASCSQVIDEATFERVIRKVAFSQNVHLRLIFRGLQAPDHPILFSMPETKYLKFLVFQKI